jgi:hypothetical protein
LSVDLSALLVDLTGLNDCQIENLGRREYGDLYLGGSKRGSLIAYDGSEVVFFEDRFDHAFFTTTDRYLHQYAKNVIAADRVARIRWIGPMLRGEVPNTQCWESTRAAGTVNIKRICIASSELFVVWLEARRNGGWKFSTTYVARAAQASDYKYGKKCVWRV